MSEEQDKPVELGEQISGMLIMSSVCEDKSGIHARIMCDDGRFVIYFIPKDAFAEQGLQDHLDEVSDIYNGFRTDENGNKERIPGFRYKRVSIIPDNQ